MALLNNPLFIQPENNDIKVWRYMNFTKFISMLETSNLFFNRADSFDDPFEGSFTKFNFLGRVSKYKDLHIKDLAMSMQPNVSYNQFSDDWQKYIAVNCWHANQKESVAMWDLYTKNNEGIAIQSTYSKLSSSIDQDNNFYMGLVQYVDYETADIDADPMNRFFHKLESYAHEKEVRLLIKKLPPDIPRSLINGREWPFEETINGGINVKVDLDILIEQIVVNPNAPAWFYDLVNKITISRYERKFKISTSKLNERPLF